MKIFYFSSSMFFLFFCFLMAGMDEQKIVCSHGIPSRTITIGNESGKSLTIITYRPDDGFCGGHVLVKEKILLASNGAVTLTVAKSALFGSLITFNYGHKPVRMITKSDDAVLRIIEAERTHFVYINTQNEMRRISCAATHVPCRVDRD